MNDITREMQVIRALILLQLKNHSRILGRPDWVRQPDPTGWLVKAEQAWLKFKYEHVALSLMLDLRL